MAVILGPHYFRLISSSRELSVSEPWQGAHQTSARGRRGRGRNRIIVKYLSQWLIERGPTRRRSHALHCLHADTLVSARVLLSCHHGQFSWPKTMTAWRAKGRTYVSRCMCWRGSVRVKGFQSGDCPSAVHL